MHLVDGPDIAYIAVNLKTLEISMKNLMIVAAFLLTITSSSFACEKVADFCATEIKFSANTAQFLKLEAALGKEIYDLNHVSQFQAFNRFWWLYQ